MRVLLATNHLERLSGSEMVTLELAEHFRRSGDDVTVFANWKELPMRMQFKKQGITIQTDPQSVRPMTFDLVYFQHHVAGLFDYTPCAEDRDRSIFAFGHLSPTGFWESAGWAHEETMADIVLANSTETADALIAAGLGRPVSVFHNAAPDDFHRGRRTALRAVPGRILLVSNHDDPALLEAAGILRGRVEVVHIGRSGERVTRVLRQTVRSTDIVVTIGKTVQYALAAGTPVYVYDHFGGPGYLTEDNFDAAAAFNFSGRCCGRKLGGAELADDILARYARARKFALAMTPERLAPFLLSRHLDALAGREPGSNDKRRARMAARRPDIDRERLLAAFVRRAYVREHRLVAKVGALRDQLDGAS